MGTGKIQATGPSGISRSSWPSTFERGIPSLNLDRYLNGIPFKNSPRCVMTFPRIESRVNTSFLEGPRSVEPTIAGVRQYLDSISHDFINKLDQEMGDMNEKASGSRWRMCGPASTALAWILAIKTGRPIGLGLQGDHIELRLGIFDPPGQPERTEEHTYIRFYNGDTCVYIDPIYGLLMKGNRDINFVEYPRDAVDTGLRNSCHIYPLSEDVPGLARIKCYGKGHSREEVADLLKQSEIKINNEVSLSPHPDLVTFVGSEVFKVAFPRAKHSFDIIKHFAPEWNACPTLRMIYEDYQRLMPARTESRTMRLQGDFKASIPTSGSFEKISLGTSGMIPFAIPKSIDSKPIILDEAFLSTFRQFMSPEKNIIKK